MQAFFYACGMFSGTISGLLGGLTLLQWNMRSQLTQKPAYAISFMNGAGGLAGWRWVWAAHVAFSI